MSEVPHDDIRTAAFRRLLRNHRPATVEELAADLGRDAADIAAGVAEMGTAGQLRRNRSGAVTGAAGLSVEPDRHVIEIDGRRFWTWCTYDILGIFGALGADGHATSNYPTPFEIRFHHGHPESTNLVILVPDRDPLDEDGATNAYDGWCPHANLFEGEEAARSWSETRGVAGRIVPVDQAAEAAAAKWAPLVADMAD